MKHNILQVLQLEAYYALCRGCSIAWKILKKIIHTVSKTTIPLYHTITASDTRSQLPPCVCLYILLLFFIRLKFAALDLTSLLLSSAVFLCHKITCVSADFCLSILRQYRSRMHLWNAILRLSGKWKELSHFCCLVSFVSTLILFCQIFGEAISTFLTLCLFCYNIPAVLYVLSFTV